MVEMGLKEWREILNFVFSISFCRMAVLWTLSLVSSYLQLFAQSFFQKPRSYSRGSPVDNSTKASSKELTTTTPICVITGATSGLGAAAAYALSKEGFYVVLAGRSSSSLSKIIEEIKQRNKGAHLKAFQVDMLSFRSMLQFKNSLQQWLLDSNMHPSIQLLINNAGILATSRRFTAEGYDQMMGTNYIGAFSLTKLLLPLLRSSSVPSRIVNVTSFTHRCVPNMQVDEASLAGNCFPRSKQYPFAQIYEYSKLCLLLFSYELHRQLRLKEKYQHVSVIAVDPGTVKTNIMREVPLHLSHFAFTVLKLVNLLQSPENGANSIIDAALASPETSGEYFFGGRGRTIKSSALSYDAKLAEKLWTNSCKLFQELQLACNEASSL